jgi:hypothetical protein
LGLSKNVEKLSHYYDRLRDGKTGEIKESHVNKVIDKLKSKRDDVMVELGCSKKASKRARLQEKITTIDTQIERAEWLLKEITKGRV